MTAIIGDTVRLMASFYTFSNVLADPDDVEVNIYEYKTEEKVNSEPLTAVKSETGKYYCDYTIPDVDDNLVYEFTGILEGTPTTNRKILRVSWLN